MWSLGRRSITKDGMVSRPCIRSFDPYIEVGEKFVDAQLIGKAEIEVGICADRSAPQAQAWSRRCDRSAESSTDTGCLRRRNSPESARHARCRGARKTASARVCPRAEISASEPRRSRRRTSSRYTRRSGRASCPALPDRSTDSRCRLVDVGDLLLQRISVFHHAFEVISALVSAIRLLPVCARCSRW